MRKITECRKINSSETEALWKLQKPNKAEIGDIPVLSLYMYVLTAEGVFLIFDHDVNFR